MGGQNILRRSGRRKSQVLDLLNQRRGISNGYGVGTQPLTVCPAGVPQVVLGLEAVARLAVPEAAAGPGRVALDGAVAGAGADDAVFLVVTVDKAHTVVVEIAGRVRGSRQICIEGAKL